jgi:hypothetical protein
VPEIERTCATCGTPGTGRFCGNCGARLTPDVEAEPVGLDVLFTHQEPEPLDPEATSVVPAAGVWTGRPPAASDDLPTDRLPAVGRATPAHIGAPVAAAAVAGPRPLRPPASSARNRRNALLAIGGIATVTVIVLLVALVLVPSLSGGRNNADTSTSAAPPSTSSAGPASSPDPSTPDPSTSETPSPSPTATPTPSSAAPAPVTTTVPARSGAAKTTKVTAHTTVTVRPTSSAVPKTTPPATTPTPTPTAAPTVAPGIPAQAIPCGRGFVVQVASELTSQAFTARVATLKKSGQLPSGSKGADTSSSCNLFSGQTNTIVLYTGPYAQPYDGCTARLAAAADSFIRSTDPADAHAYVSCLCPANTGRLPTLSKVGQQDVWVGELQRVLGNRLNVNISDLGNNWGVYSAGTKAAVQKFQQAAKLPANGVVDARTWNALNAAQGC